MASLEFLCPVAPTNAVEQPLAARLDHLAGATIALLDNQKANAGHLLVSVGAELQRRHPGIELVTAKKIATSPSPEDVMARLRQCDAVILAIAD